MSDQTAKSPNSRRQSILPRLFGVFGGGLLTPTVVLFLVGTTPAFAQSGETEDTFFQIPAADCETLRVATDLPDGDLIFICDAARRSCQLVEGGRAFGFCADSFPDGVRPVRSSPIETDVEIMSTTHGTITGFEENGDFADLVCETFVTDGGNGTGVKACRKIVEAELPGPLPSCDGFFTESNDEDACALLDQLWAESVSPEPPDISFALFIDVDNAGQPGSEALLVCPGRELQCASPSVLPSQITIEYQFDKSIINTPGCKTVSGKTTCW